MSNYKQHLHKIKEVNKNIKIAFISAEFNREHTKSISDELKILHSKIKVVANNINNITHHSNIDFIITQEEEQNLLLELKKLEDIVMNYVKD